MAQHTPSPWTAKRDRRRTAPWHIEGDGGLVAEVLAQGSFGTALPEETQANASLIAAAPDLLAAVRGLLKAVEGSPIGMQAALAVTFAQSAVAKAEGR